MPPNLPSWGYFIFLIPTNLGNGFVMPSTLLSILATSAQADQAVAASTLIMWRSLGSVFGVAVSSGIVQNFLSFFLESNITGDDKQDIIRTVRKSVQSIFDLDPLHQQQGLLFPLVVSNKVLIKANSGVVLPVLTPVLLHIYKYYCADFDIVDL